jgi:hypothetical protein
MVHSLGAWFEGGLYTAMKIRCLGSCIMILKEESTAAQNLTQQPL